MSFRTSYFSALVGAVCTVTQQCSQSSYVATVMPPRRWDWSHPLSHYLNFTTRFDFFIPMICSSRLKMEELLWWWCSDNDHTSSCIVIWHCVYVSLKNPPFSCIPLDWKEQWALFSCFKVIKKLELFSVL